MMNKTIGGEKQKQVDKFKKFLFEIFRFLKIVVLFFFLFCFFILGF